MSLTTSEIAKRVGGELVGDGSTSITGLSSADLARSGELTFAENDKYFAAAENSPAAAIIVDPSSPQSNKVLIRVQNVRVAVAQLLPLFNPPAQFPAGIHPTATIDPTAEIDSTAHLGPNCVIGPRVKIGPRTVLMGGNHIGPDSQLASEVCLHPHVVAYARTQIGNRVIIHAGTVIGSDGYGYVFDRGRHLKVLQIGHVIIEDDVEIGANTAIDRAAFGATVIGAGTKIDNLVHVAHNVVFGKNCLIMGQSGFAGSTHLGDYCVIASQSGVAGHLKLGRQSTVGAKSGVMRDVADGETVLGIPAMPHKQTKRQWIANQQLPEMIRRLRDLEQQVLQLSTALQSGDTQPPSEQAPA